MGTNDVPTITVGSGNSIAASLTETSAALSATGTLLITDVDQTNIVTPSVFSVVKSGITAGIISSDAVLKSMLTVSPSPVIGSTAITGTLTWSFASGSEKFDYLADGEILTLVYTVRVTDSNSPATTADQTVTITITGTNDAPTITIGSGNSAAASLTETSTTLTSTGTLTVTDLDYTNTVVASVASVVASGVTAGIISNNAALLAMLAVTPTNILSNTATTAQLTWNFNSGSEAFDYLATGQVLTLTYVVQAVDSNGTPAGGTRNVVITITGTNDVPTVTLSGGDSDASPLTETDLGLSTTGTLTVTDLDYTNT
ncbi:MAG: hypothetical protein EBT02_17290, partial [Planctomycetia bacterium]|nr:hypothetical protein [Planctomycetia bacterium]